MVDRQQEIEQAKSSLTHLIEQYNALEQAEMEFFRCMPGLFKWIRAELGLSQNKLAHRLGINNSYVSKFEAGTQPASKRIVFKLSQILEEIHGGDTMEPDTG